MKDQLHGKRVMQPSWPQFNATKCHRARMLKNGTGKVKIIDNQPSFSQIARICETKKYEYFSCATRNENHLWYKKVWHINIVIFSHFGRISFDIYSSVSILVKHHKRVPARKLGFWSIIISLINLKILIFKFDH